MLQAPHTLDAVHSRQIDIHQHGVRAVVGEPFQRGFRIGVLAQAAETVRAVEQTRQRVAQLLVVFDDGNRDWHVRRLPDRMAKCYTDLLPPSILSFPKGPVNRTTVPPSAPGLIVKVPPISSSRLRMLLKPFLVRARSWSMLAMP